MTFTEYLDESGDSASKVKWKNENGAEVGIFTVTSNNDSAEFTIVINSLKKCKNIEILSFKFYDADFNIEANNLMYFHLGVGPTIKFEFEKLIRTGPDAIIFSADKHEKTRVKLYDKYTALMAKKYKYVPFYKTAITSEYDEYVLVNPNKIQEFKNCYPTSEIK